MSLAGSKPVAATNIVEDTWERIGHKLRPIGKQICVRTQIPKRITDGGIILTDRQASFYAGLPNVGIQVNSRGEELDGTKMVIGTACSIGEKVTAVEVGERLFFPRGFFARYEKLDDDSMVGWIREENVWAIFDPEEGDEE